VLDIDGCELITDRSVVEIAKEMKFMQVFSAPNCPKLSNGTLNACAKYWKTTLKKLVLSFSLQKSFSIQSIDNLAQNCTRLRTLELVHVFGRSFLPTHEFIASPSPTQPRSPQPSVCQSLSKLKGLQRLDVTASTEVSDFQSLQECQTLTELHAGYCTKLDSRSLSTLSHALVNLHTLCVKYCALVDGNALISVSKHCVGLESLDVSGMKANQVSGDELQTALVGFQNLKELVLDSVATLNDGVIDAFCKHSLSNSTLQRLSYSQIPSNSVTMRSLVSVFHSLVHLKSLDISHNTNITISSPFPTTDSHKLRAKSLRSLNITGCKDISDRGFRYVMESCDSLSTLSCSQLELVTDASLHALSEHGKSLRYLSMVGCLRLTDCGVLKMLENVVVLKSVSIQFSRVVNGVTLGMDSISVNDIECSRVLKYYVETGGDSDSLTREWYTDCGAQSGGGQQGERSDSRMLAVGLRSGGENPAVVRLLALKSRVLHGWKKRFR